MTKSPTDETVEAGGSCWFVAKYENAIWAEWHFVSPDGKTDLDYSKINTQFSKLEVVKGFASTTQLNNIPAEMDGWKVYCRFSNDAGSVNTGTASITVTSGSGTQAAQIIQETDPYPGTYVEKGRGLATLNVSGSPDLYRVTITWPDGYGKSSTWSFTGHFDESGVMAYNSCVKTDTTYDENNHPTDTTVYTNGQGRLEFSSANGGIYWTDATEAIGDNTFFAKN